MPPMKRTIVVAILLVACKKEKAEPPPDPAAKTVVEPKAEPPKKKAETTAAVLGKSPAMFGNVSKLTWGMTQAEAEAAAPDLTDEDNALAFKLEYEFDKLARVEIDSTAFGNFEKLGEEAWGKGTVNKAHIGEKTYWFVPATHTRAVADSSTLVLSEYLPLEEFLGPDKVNIAAFPKPLWGVTLEDVRAVHGARMKPEDKLDHIYFPPTEYDHEYLSVFVLYSKGKGKTDSVSFEIADGPDQNTTLALFEKKWGKPKMSSSYGAKELTAVFHSKNPLIEVERAVNSRSWDVDIRVKDDACGGACYKGL